MLLLFLLTIICGPQGSFSGSDYSLSSSIQVQGRQGIACDGEYYYVSGSSALYKYNKGGKLLTSNENPFDSLRLSANHLGDIDVFDGHIYAGAETFIDGVGTNIQVAVYSAETLQYEYSLPWNGNSGQVEVCGVAVDRDNSRIWMADWVQGSSLYCYDLDSGKYLGKTFLSPAPELQQGIFCKDGCIYISSDDGNADTDEPDHIYCCKPEIGDTTEVELWRDMTEFKRQGEIEGICFDPSCNSFIVLSNRGSRIKLGMVCGLYDGYSKEIHDLYVYRPNQVVFFKDLFPVGPCQAAFVHSNHIITLSNGGHATAYKLQDGSGKFEFSLGSADMKPHCNSADCNNGCIYVSEWNNGRRCFVEKISHHNKIWNSKVVQEISFDIDEDIAGTGYTDWVPDFKNKKIYSLTYVGGGARSDYGCTGIILLEFPLPSVSKGKRVVFTSSDILRRAELPAIRFTQDKKIRDGKLFILAGVTTKKLLKQPFREQERQLVVIDLESFSIKNVYPLGFYNHEPEGIVFWKKKTVLTFHSDWCKEVVFPGE